MKIFGKNINGNEDKMNKNKKDFGVDFYKFHDDFIIKTMNNVIDDFNDVYNYDKEFIENWKSGVKYIINEGKNINSLGYYYRYTPKYKRRTIVHEIDFEYIIYTLKCTLTRTSKTLNIPAPSDDKLKYISSNVNDFKEEISFFKGSLFNYILRLYLGLI